jgi:vacuolar protein sorting-associated protein VTA1
MKADIGPNDAVDIESVSSAYVEQFALKVFANADNEDRNGRATRYKKPIFELVQC